MLSASVRKFIHDYETSHKFLATMSALQAIHADGIKMIASTDSSVTFKVHGGANYLKFAWDEHGVNMLVFTPSGGVLTDLWDWGRFKVYWDEPNQCPQNSRKMWDRHFTYSGGMFVSEYKFPFSNEGVDTLFSLVGFTVRRSNRMTQDNREAVRALKLARLEEEVLWAMTFQEPNKTVASQ